MRLLEICDKFDATLEELTKGNGKTKMNRIYHGYDYPELAREDKLQRVRRFNRSGPGFSEDTVLSKAMESCADTIKHLVEVFAKADKPKS